MRKTPSIDGVLCFKSLISLNCSENAELAYEAKLLILLNSSRKAELTYEAKSLILLNCSRKSELTYEAKLLIFLNSCRKSELTYEAKSLILLNSGRKSELLNSPDVDCFRVCDYSLFRKLVDFFVMQLLLHAVFNRPFSNFLGHR